MPHPQNTDLYIYWNDSEKINQDEHKQSMFMLAQWRKHANLQGYMEALYEKKGGEGTFNCSPVRLTFQDLKDLKQAVMNNRLPQTVGFFFGTSDPDHDTETLEFIDKAMKAIAQDMEIYYDSWW
jgi:hypothetical protein